MCFFPVFNVFLLKTPSAEFMNAFCISPNRCSISDLKFVPKGILEILFVSRLNRNAKSFPSTFFQVYFVGLSFASQTWVSLMILFGRKMYFLVRLRRIGWWSNKKLTLSGILLMPKLNRLYFIHESLHMSSALEGLRAFCCLKSLTLFECISLTADVRIHSLKCPDCFLPI